MTPQPSDVKWPYPVGTIGKPWSATEKQEWTDLVNVPKRSYNDEVIQKLKDLKLESDDNSVFELVNYGSLSHNPERYPLYAVKSREWTTVNSNTNKSESNKKLGSILITGGVHGYETSGVQGAILFIQHLTGKHPESETSKIAERFADKFNFIVAPCVSPWGYECIQRWTKNAVDPNRSFIKKKDVDGAKSESKSNAHIGATESQTDESSALMNLLEKLNYNTENSPFIMHLDLHETTDTDATEFRPAKAARDGNGEFNPKANDEKIPDGFYLVGDSSVFGDSESDYVIEMKKWNKSVLDHVEQITHLVKDKEVLGFQVQERAMVYIPVQELSLCASLTGPIDTKKNPYRFVATTEVYPDSQTGKLSGDECNKAQVAAIIGGLEYFLSSKKA